MWNPEHLDLLKSGVEQWNAWRTKNEDICPDLNDADLNGVDLSGANLSSAQLFAAELKATNLSHADLSKANLYHAGLQGANLNRADLTDANLSNAELEGADLRNTRLVGTCLERANLSKVQLEYAMLQLANLRGANLEAAHLCDTDFCDADLRDANLNQADLANAYLWNANLRGALLKGALLTNAKLNGAFLNGADLSGANLNAADLTQAVLIDTDLTGANLYGAKIYGTSVWDIKKEGLIQHNLVITPEGKAEITVDDLEVAQFIYFLLNNQNIRNVIDTLTSKAVLILGRFTADRKPLLDAIKDALRARNYLPILFDFEKPASRDLTETISILAKMSRFVIADLTDAKSIPQELSHIIPFSPSLPVLPIILQNQQEYAMFEHFRAYPWVLPLYAYETPESMLAELVERVIEPAERKVGELGSGGR